MRKSKINLAKTQAEYEIFKKYNARTAISKWALWNIRKPNTGLDSDCSLGERCRYYIVLIIIIIGRIAAICISRIWSNSMTWLINYASRSCCDTLTINACCESWIGFYLCSGLWYLVVLRSKYCNYENDGKCNNHIAMITMMISMFLFHHAAVILFLLLLKMTMSS